MNEQLKKNEKPFGFRAHFKRPFLYLAVGLLPALLFLLVACSEQSTPLSLVEVSPTPTSQPTLIPTFTAVPVSPTVAEPTLIIVPPTATARPTPTPAPTAPPAPTPTATPQPTATARPTLAADAFKQVSLDEARNLNGYRARFPTFLPADFKLSRISVSETTNPRLITLITEYRDGQGQVFYFNTQVFPAQPPTPLPQPPTATPGPPVGAGTARATPTATLPPPTPRPTAPSAVFGQLSVNINGQPGLLSYSQLQTTLSWAEGSTRYFINGPISKEDIVKVAESLK